MTDEGSLPFVNEHTYDCTNVDDGKVKETTINNATQKASKQNKNKFTPSYCTFTSCDKLRKYEID